MRAAALAACAAALCSAGGAAATLGAGACYAFSPQFAKLATLRYTLILPAVLGIVYIGAFEASRNWGDLFALLLFGLLGWVMKQHKWPRPPLVLGLVLGDSIERYMFISIERYGFSWLWRPVVIVLLVMAIIGVVRPFIADIRSQGGIRKMMQSFQAPRFHPSQIFTMFYIAVIGTMVAVAIPWHFSAKLVPLVVGTHALVQEAVRFRQLGLVIIDEQHRFGVVQRADLRAKGII